MYRLLFIFSLVLSLTSCTLFHVHRMDIQQGNYFTREMAHRIHPGMSRAAVKEILGSPVLINTFRNNRVDYVYTFMAANRPIAKAYLTLVFRGNILSEIKGNMYSQYIKDF